MPPQPYQPSRRASLILLAAITLAAAALRLPWLAVDSLWFDEAATWSQLDGSFADMVSRTLRDNYPPLYNTLAWPLVQLFGDAERVLRLPAALLGVALPPMAYALGARAGGRAAGLLAALLLALSPFHVWYSLEARMYSLLALTACAYAWAALRDLDRPSRGSGVLLVALGLALLLSHPFGALDWFAVSVPLLLRAERRWRLVRLFVITLALFLPFGAALAFHAVEVTTAGFWIPEPTAGFVYQQLSNLTSTLLPGLALLAIAAGVPGRTALRGPALPILVSLTIVPALLAYLASLAATPVVLDRYLIGSLPALAVLAAVGATRWPLPRWGFAAVAAITTVAGILTLLYATPPHRYDWRGAAAYVRQALQPGDCVIVHPPHNSWTWRYYDRAPACLETVPELEPQLAAPPFRRLFLAVEEQALGELDDVIPRLEAHLPLVSTQHFNRLVVYEFGAAP